MKIGCCPPLHTRTRVSSNTSSTCSSPSMFDKSRFEDFKEVFQCDTCNESYPILAELEEHRQTDHHELISYNCKLCNEKFESPEFHSMHRNYKGHQELSESVDEQFMLQKGNICEECYFLDTEETFNFCENGEYFEIFQTIWSNRQCSSIYTLV